jgi:hypothetical protein
LRCRRFHEAPSPARQHDHVLVIPFTTAPPSFLPVVAIQTKKKKRVSDQ